MQEQTAAPSTQQNIDKLLSEAQEETAIQKLLQYSLEELKATNAVHGAAKNGKFYILKTLIDTYPELKGSLHTRHHLTPLHFAAQELHLPIVQYLLEKDANPNYNETLDPDGHPLNWSPLHCAVCQPKKIALTTK